jgi:hypothetical protein
MKVLLGTIFAVNLVAASVVSPPQISLLDTGYRQMYNLQFADAHASFREWERLHPADPMGPVSDAAAYLFAEFDRLHILESEFFTHDNSFFQKQNSLVADPNAKQHFQAALDRAGHLIETAKAASPAAAENNDLANLLRIGLHSDYLALIEKRNMAALSEIKQSRALSDSLLARHPDCYDAHLAAGLENYMLSLKPAAIRFMARLGGAQTDKQTGLARLRITAQKGHYLLPYARLLLAVAALRDQDTTTARTNLQWLATEFPNNRLYREELNKLK